MECNSFNGWYEEKQSIYDMSDYNEILKDIDAFGNVQEIEYKGVAEIRIRSREKQQEHLCIQKRK